MLFAFSAQMFSQLGVLAGYELNKHYIIEKFCVNRDKPEMHCDGKCYLKKKLQQDQQRKNSESNINNRLDILLFCSEEESPFVPVLNSSKYIFSGIPDRFYTAPLFSFFHPPRVSVHI